MGERNQQNRGRSGTDDDTDDADDSNKETPMSKEDIRRLVVSTVNGTVEKTVKKSFEGLNIGSQIQEALQASLGPLTEQFEALKANNTQAPKNQQNNQAPQVPPELQRKLDALQKQVESSEQARKKAEDEQKSLADKSRRKEERDHLGAALRKAGVPDELASAAVSMLAEKGVIKRGDDDSIGWSHEDEILPVDKGVAQWMKTDGKAFLPARPVNGSGAGRNGGIHSGQNQSKGEQIASDIAVLAGLGDF